MIRLKYGTDPVATSYPRFLPAPQVVSGDRGANCETDDYEALVFMVRRLLEGSSLYLTDTPERIRRRHPTSARWSNVILKIFHG